MRHGEVLPPALRRGEATHGDATQLVRRHQLADRLSSLARVRHAHVFECAFLGTWTGINYDDNVNLVHFNLLAVGK